MPSTYMDLTNRLLRRLNDVELNSANFNSARGIQATAKDVIQDTVREINATKLDWPFNAVEHTQVLQLGVEEYAWPTNFNSCDWNSFQLQKDANLNVNSRSLKPISREEWYALFRNQDDDVGNTGRGVPNFCFPSHGQGWGVSPSPNELYTIKYRYYKVPIELVNYDDQVTIPTKYDYVIIAGALYYMNLFKENDSGVAIMEKKFKDGVADMLGTFLPNPGYVYDGRTNLGGGTFNTGGDSYYWYKG